MKLLNSVNIDGVPNCATPGKQNSSPKGQQNSSPKGNRTHPQREIELIPKGFELRKKKKLFILKSWSEEENFFFEINDLKKYCILKIKEQI